MSMCLVALVVLAFLSIFSARYRRWAKEAFQCVTRRLTLRPCNTGFNEKVRAVITSKLMKRHMGLARFAHRHFEAISWVFTIVMFASLAYTAYGMYNLAVLGTCDPTNPENCIFNPGGDPNRVVCPYVNLEPGQNTHTIGGFSDITAAAINGRPTFYFFGTTWCPHCAWEKPVFENVAAKFSAYADINATYIDSGPSDEGLLIFNHYSPDGYIPLIIIGGKYYRIGSGEQFGEEQETEILTALMCKATGSPIKECSDPAVAQLTEKI